MNGARWVGTSGSHWLDEPFVPLVRRSLAGAPDVAVVGAGITGCSAAYALARAGARVWLFDARGVAEGASGRNGGFALRGAAMPYDVAMAAIGHERAAEMWRWTEAAMGQLASLAGDAFRPTGSLRIANDDEEREDLRREHAALAADGFAAEWVDDLDSPLAGRTRGAIFRPADVVLQRARFVRRLAALAVEAGVELREHWYQTEEGRIVAGGFRDLSLASELTVEERTTPQIQAVLEARVADLVG